MKKILFLLIVLVIKLNAYEYLFYKKIENEDYQERFFYDNNGHLVYKRITQNGVTLGNLNYNIFNSIKRHSNVSFRDYIGIQQLKEYYTNDLNFLNDLYTQSTNIFLNYLYNESNFTNQSYINYENYEILYNDQGLAVESIVNGIWAGLYSNDEIQNSGYLYNASGQLVYKNGLSAKLNDEFVKFMDDMFIGSVKSAFYSIAEGFHLGMVVCVFLVLGGVMLILRLLLFALQGNYSFRGSNGFRSDRGPIEDKRDYGIEEDPRVLRERRQAIAGIKAKMKRNGLI